ncbi:hypothetical protein [Gimesia fumaroli]|uniref:Uncharacterized protein n=1 Tax=Gimesia fumaroli TaxID=2527976 RepID=A0A518I8E2_9PLAN|nr:hypothetical protein [Gimesia fumaroli]QDV49383.1 hypothetical protein Enr17x_14000 [Gimesia fumaroli]
MYRVFVLILIGSLALPAVPVSGCECSQKQSGQTKACCCSKAGSNQTKKQKACCCQASQKRKKQETHNQIQCQKQNCHCNQTFQQPATTISVKSTELARQLRENFESVDLTAELCFSARPASTRSFELPPPVHAYDSGEFCAHFCLWLI